jgi:hypothetical protein
VVIGLAVAAGLLSVIVCGGWTAFLLRDRTPADQTRAPDEPAPPAPVVDSPAPAPTPNGPAGAAPKVSEAPAAAVSVDPADLCRAFRMDPAGAAERFRGKPVELTAAVAKAPGLNPGARPFAVLPAGGRDILSTFFVDAQAERVAALGKGQRVRVRGTVGNAVVDRADSAVTLTLNGCVLLD